MLSNFAVPIPEGRPTFFMDFCCCTNFRSVTKIERCVAASTSRSELFLILRTIVVVMLSAFPRFAQRLLLLTIQNAVTTPLGMINLTQNFNKVVGYNIKLISTIQCLTLKHSLAEFKLILQVNVPENSIKLLKRGSSSYSHIFAERLTFAWHFVGYLAVKIDQITYLLR